MSHSVASLLTAAGLIVVLDGNRYTVAKDHPNFHRIKDALASKSYDALVNLMDVRSAVKNWLAKDKDFTLTDDQVLYEGRKFSDGVTLKVLKMIEAGADPEPIFAFLRKVRLNPSKTAQDELLLFCVANGFLIHEDGDILAYKSVRSDYTDLHSGKVLNTVGATVEMPRGAVDDDRDRTCSSGLHFASHEYASTWHGRSDTHLLVMKIHPADVVSIPSDYHNQKGRCCKYVVLTELPSDTAKMPVKEVLTDADLGVVKSTGCRGDATCPCGHEKHKVQAEISKLEEALGLYEPSLVAAVHRVTVPKSDAEIAAALKVEVEKIREQLKQARNRFTELTK
jgi:hypothetical protein